MSLPPNSLRYQEKAFAEAKRSVRAKGFALASRTDTVKALFREAMMSHSDLADGLIAKFDPSQKGFPWAQYDGVPDAYPDEVTLLDCAVSLCMRSNIRLGDIAQGPDDFAKLCKYSVKQRIDEFLRETRPSASLWEEDKLIKPHLDNLKEIVLSVSNVPGWRVAKLTKVLHRKRPLFVPMLDSRVQKAYLFGDVASGEYDITTEMEIAVIDEFRAELVEHLENIRRVVELAHGKAPSIVPSSISPVRCLEALVFWYSHRWAKH